MCFKQIDFEGEGTFSVTLFLLYLFFFLLVEALRYKLEGRGFDFRWCHWNFSFAIIFPAGLCPWGRISL